MRPYNNIDWNGIGDTLIRIVSESELTPNLTNADDNDADATDVQPVDNTEVAPRELPTQPCRLKPGSKFEYSIRDVVEFGRRHQRILAVDLTGVIGYTNATPPVAVTDQYSFEVFPQHWLNYLYAGWSGTLKYRIFVNYRASLGATNTHPTVTYIPCPDATGTDVNIEMFNADGVSGGIRGTWDTSAPFTQAQRQDLTYCQGAEERLWQQTSTYAYIDISVPFYSEHNFLNTRSTYNYNNHSNGRIVITWPRLTVAAKLEVYQAFGDDFRYHCWSPYNLMRYSTHLQVSGTAPTSGTVLGMHKF